MSDIVERLKASAKEVMEFPHPSACDHLHSAHHLMLEAAAELARLREQVADLQECIALELAENKRLFDLVGLHTADDFGHDDATQAIARKYNELKEKHRLCAEE